MGKRRSSAWMPSATFIRPWIEPNPLACAPVQSFAAPSSPTDETCWSPEEPGVAQEALQGTFSNGHINRLGALEPVRVAYASSWGVSGVFEGAVRLVLDEPSMNRSAEYGRIRALFEMSMVRREAAKPRTTTSSLAVLRECACAGCSPGFCGASERALAPAIPRGVVVLRASTNEDAPTPKKEWARVAYPS